MTVQNSMKIVSNEEYQHVLGEYNHLVKHPKELVTRTLEGQALQDYLKSLEKKVAKRRKNSGNGAIQTFSKRVCNVFIIVFFIEINSSRNCF